jgi:hypothetical protein
MKYKMNQNHKPQPQKRGRPPKGKGKAAKLMDAEIENALPIIIPIATQKSTRGKRKQQDNDIGEVRHSLRLHKTTVRTFL